MIHFYSDYCYRKIWICISFGTLFIACCTLIILFIYHYYQRCYRMKNSIQNISKQYRIKNKKLDKQVEELIRLTPIIPFEKIKFNEFNQIIILPNQLN